MITKENTVLLIGATGYLGQKILAQLAHRADTHIIATVRASSAERIDALRKHCDEIGAIASIEFVSADLTDAAPFRELSTTAITHIIHTAADTRFTITSEIADTLNRDGSRKVFEFARSLPNLKAMVYLSSIYACGLNAGTIPEMLLPRPAAFANHYERSKFEAEQMLGAEFDDLPWQILRVATVIADDIDGRVEQINVFHNTAGLIHHGLISILPGDPDTSIYFVPADLVASNSIDLCFAGSAHSVRHLCFPKPANLKLQTIVDIMMETFAEEERFVSRRILRPLLTDLANFLAVSEVVDKGFAGLILKQAVESIKPFAPQMFSDKDFCVTLPDFAASTSDNYQRQLLQHTLRYLMRSVWRSQRKESVA